MIINDKINLNTFGNRRLDYFKSLGYDTSGDTFEINIEHLNKGSKILVDVECDYCGRIVNIKYKEYIRNISSSCIKKYACSKKCGTLKAKEKNLKEIGVSHPMKLKEIQEKSKNTNLKRYGVEFLMQSKDIREKSKNTLIKKYNVDHISKTENFKKKFKETCLKNNGVEYPMMSEKIKQKSKETFINNYGVDNPSKSIEIKKLIKYNNLLKYGVEHTSKIDEVKLKIKRTKLEKYGNMNYNNINKIKETIKLFTKDKWREINNKAKSTKLERYGNMNYNNSDKIKKTMSLFTIDDWIIINMKRKLTNIKKYGVDNIYKYNMFRYKFDICKNENYIEYLSNNKSLFKCDLNESHYFSISSDNYYNRKKLNIPLCTVCNPIGETKSIKEKKLFEFIKQNYSGDIIQSYKDGLEIDIYLPDLKIGFEFNDLYFHSERFKNKNYHLDKTNYFKDKGIRIIHIWEDDWTFKQNIVKSMINNLLGNSKRLFARKCQIRELKNVTEFLNLNHIQGADRSNIKLGLYFEDELVSVMTFNTLEGRNKMGKNEYNLSRFCNKLGYNVVGGASKLLNYLKRFIIQKE
jgi:DNA-directed RNA polymerase subunit N (RpoN/RPB10)